MNTPSGSRSTVRRELTKESCRAPDSFRAQQREGGGTNISLNVVYVGLAIAPIQGSISKQLIGMTIHDGTYTLDYESYQWPQPGDGHVSDCQPLSSSSPSSFNFPTDLADFIVGKIRKYRKDHKYKIAGGAVTSLFAQLCPSLPSLLWKKLDIVCFIFQPFTNELGHEAVEDTESIVDEESDCVVRKALSRFGPGDLPRPVINRGNVVGVDSDGMAHITNLEDYQGTVHKNTWEATMKVADELKKNNVKIAFFNTTPQGGGVALMRHALIRFLRLVGVNCEWYVPRPNSSVFRLTKTNHNILQGVNEIDRLAPEHISQLDDWVDENANRSWLRKGGPLAPRSKGGAHIIVVDDPQMPKLVQIAKQQDPSRPVIYRSHIQVRADLVYKTGTPAAGVWDWIWDRIKDCDVFISHPVNHFVPGNVPKNKVGYMPATTDWLDGLNKPLSTDLDGPHYLHEFAVDISRSHPNGPFVFDFPDTTRPYICQIARFDPAKGIPDVLASYAHLRRNLMKDAPVFDIPQLVIAGHGAIDDPDARPIYDQTVNLINEKYKEFERDIIVMRVGPTDQILNALLQNATVALQLSTREGFEVKVSEALKAGVPVIATRRGGIPLQVVHEKSGYLVEVDDREHETVATHLHHLLTDKRAHEEFDRYATHHVSDEVSTVGNAMCWLYLADALSKGDNVLEHGPTGQVCWVSDMARKKAGIEWADDEITLPRSDGLPKSDCLASPECEGAV
ncbi:hypothetical protein DE146DRAFT_706970 [Phaeosphaeria sp. MPI-PUGE-AT-0046c]|nr:hypothetical protein DE146DRAFT_706970 [Phaeosphaeria sp. MPI-PUGE-AT-0046c]